MTQLDDLTSAGFARSGCWRAIAPGGIELDFLSPRDGGVYAYVVDKKVMYVGSAQRGLHRRFRNYILSKTMRTSQRVREEIVRQLEAGKVVEIYTIIPPPHFWNGLPVDLIAGLEEGLIRLMKPAWNRRSNPSRLQTREADES